MARALTLSVESKLPNLFSFTVQRIASIRTQEALRVLAERLGRTENPAQQTELARRHQSDREEEVRPGSQRSWRR